MEQLQLQLWGPPLLIKTKKARLREAKTVGGKKEAKAKTATAQSAKQLSDQKTAFDKLSEDSAKHLQRKAKQL